LNLVVGAGEIGKKMVSKFGQFKSKRIDRDKSCQIAPGQIVNNVHQVDEFLPNPCLPDTLSEMAVPMIIGNCLLGVFDAQSD
jgi:hypothetical protein